MRWIDVAMAFSIVGAGIFLDQHTFMVCAVFGGAGYVSGRLLIRALRG